MDPSKTGPAATLPQSVMNQEEFFVHGTFAVFQMFLVLRSTQFSQCCNGQPGSRPLWLREEAAVTGSDPRPLPEHVLQQDTEPTAEAEPCLSVHAERDAHSDIISGSFYIAISPAPPPTYLHCLVISLVLSISV